MKITALSAQVRNPDRVNVSVDGKYKFSLDISQVIDLGVKIGNEYDEAELAELEIESQFGKLYARALEYCLVRPRSGREMRDYLYRKTLSKKYLKKDSQKGSSFNRVEKSANRIVEIAGASPEVTARVFDRLVEKGHIDDEKFARWWVENRNVRKGASRRKLQAELQAKGMPSDIINGVIEESDREDSDELAKIIAKKRHKYSDDQKFMQYLARQGFSYDDIKAVLQEE